MVDEGSNTVNAEEPSVLVIEPSSPAPVITVVVSASILSLFVVAAFTNEGLRLPATAAGLWFLGLIGKTHETTDGRYQRGRATSDAIRDVPSFEMVQAHEHDQVAL